MPPDLQPAEPAGATLVDRVKRFILAFRQVCQGYMMPSPGC